MDRIAISSLRYRPSVPYVLDELNAQKTAEGQPPVWTFPSEGDERLVRGSNLGEVVAAGASALVEIIRGCHQPVATIVDFYPVVNPINTSQAWIAVKTLDQVLNSFGVTPHERFVVEDPYCGNVLFNTIQIETVDDGIRSVTSFVGCETMALVVSSESIVDILSLK